MSSNEGSPVAEIAKSPGSCADPRRFRDLEEGQLQDLAGHVGVGAFPAGTEKLVQAGEPARHLFVIRRGAVDLFDEGHAVGQVGRGDLFGTSVFSGLGPVLTARGREDAECYLIDPDRARMVMGSASGLAFLATRSAQ